MLIIQSVDFQKTWFEDTVKKRAFNFIIDNFLGTKVSFFFNLMGFDNIVVMSHVFRWDYLASDFHLSLAIKEIMWNLMAYLYSYSPVVVWSSEDTVFERLCR